MRYLLDTHAVLWFLIDDDQLPASPKEVIVDNSNECFVSIASLWEIAIKHSLGKLELQNELSQLFRIISDSGFRLLPITPAHILSNVSLPFVEGHRDPFDRLIISQAQAEGLTIISKDHHFSKYEISLLWE